MTSDPLSSHLFVLAAGVLAIPNNIAIRKNSEIKKIAVLRKEVQRLLYSVPIAR